MNGKKSSVLTSRQTGTSSVLLTLLAASVSIALLGILITSASAYHDSAIARVHYIPTVEVYEVYDEKDLEYIEKIVIDRAIHEFYADLVQDSYIASLVLAAAREYEISDIEVLFALMWLESGFNPNAINTNSTSIDRGLFQLNSRVYARYDEELFFDVEWNIRTGVRHYAIELSVANGDHQYALYAYNAGRSRRFNPPPITKVYAERILQYAEELRNLKSQYVTQIIAVQRAQYQ